MKNTKIIELIKKNGGLTLDENMESMKAANGFMVSLYGMEYKTKEEKEVIKKIIDYISFIKNKKGLFVGVWLDNGVFYVDISIKIIDKMEALETGKKNKQISIYDIKNNNYLYIKDYNFIKFYNVYEVVRNNNNDIIDYKLTAQNEKIKELINYFNCNIQTIKNTIYTNLQKDYSRLIDGRYIIIKDYEVI